MATDSPHENRSETYAFFETFFGQADLSTNGWSPPREYPVLTEIFVQDTPAKAVYFIDYGLVKLSRSDSSGHEMIAGLRRRSWIIGAPAVLLGKQYSFTATALTDCRLRRIASGTFLGFIEKKPEFARQMLRMFSQEIFNYSKAFCSLGCLPAMDRLKQLLYEIMREINPTSYKDQVKLNFPLKHKELAQMIAITPEHLSRLLKHLERDGIIKREKSLLILSNIQSLMQECRMH
jgi:CRP/FNR family transcriptional regulator